MYFPPCFCSFLLSTSSLLSLIILPLPSSLLPYSSPNFLLISHYFVHPFYPPSTSPSVLLCLKCTPTCNMQNVITIQPPPTIIVYERKYGTGDHFLLLSILLSFLFFFCGCWAGLICTIPAIFFALSVSYVTVQFVPKSCFNCSVNVLCL